ncbi:MAG TPA: DUF4197 domain-containing protein [Verrucomicrobiae bacterium]|nr:DUF4197 domain-containing protein [Verrucomicrobiae bacterium]
MKAGRCLGPLLAVIATVFTTNTFAASADTSDSTNRSRGLSGIFEQLLKTTLTNLTQSRTNIATTRTNIPTTTNIVSVQTNTASLAAIPAFELSAGVKEAIASGLAHAVTTLGRTNGFFTNTLAKIELPAQLANMDKMVRALGQGPLVDQFVATMNHAAEQAVPVATSIFTDSLSQMTIADARDLLLANSKTAATEYFRRTTTNQLTEKFLPIVREATEKTGVTAAYKNLTAKVPFASVLVGGNDFNIDDYVTSKALDGLFTMVANEEIRIRENPQARVTELLQKVFGALPQTGIGAPPPSQTGGDVISNRPTRP